MFLLFIVGVNITIAGIPSESPLPPTSLTSIPSDTNISLMWSHSDECFENCTFMYEVTWQQSGDGSSLRNATTTDTSYTIEGLTPGTSYEIGVMTTVYCTCITSRSEGILTLGTVRTLPHQLQGMYIHNTILLIAEIRMHGYCTYIWCFVHLSSFYTKFRICYVNLCWWVYYILYISTTPTP